jgi:hypothetical protein
MKFRYGWLAVLLTLTFVPTVQAADDWKIYRYPQYGFAAEYPTEPGIPESPDTKRFLESFSVVAQ